MTSGATLDWTVQRQRQHDHPWQSVLLRPGQTFVIVDNDGSDAVSGTFNSPCFGCIGTPYAEGSTITSGGFSFRISYHGGTGNDVVLTATVSGAGPTPTGTVTFLVNGSSVGTAPRASGQASMSISTIGTGGQSITATYNGDASYGTSTSSPACAAAAAATRPARAALTARLLAEFRSQ